MGFDEVFTKLRENPLEISKEAIKIIVKIADNIIKNPKDPKVRILHKNNLTISKKILAAKGALECLKIMGFEENDNCLILPASVPVEKVTEAKDTILMWTDSVAEATKEDVKVENNETKDTDADSERVKKITLPPLVFNFTNPFLRSVERHFNECLQYENKDLRRRAQKLIPIAILQNNALENLRIVQTHIKKNNLPDLEESLEDFLILELLAWFKEHFFSWVDSPDCRHCGLKTKFSHMCTDPRQLIYTDRVELHKCESCNKFTAFPRYQDVNILLETKRGRCGEWANVFTLFCISLGWDARIVVDSSDHVWTEVFSLTRKQWVHCDPCENVCDTPLMYETGWKKQISYIIAYSPDDIQDVTWRYSSNHKEVLKRRKACSENELLDCLMKLRETRQKNLSEARRKYLTKRTLLELAELMVERKPKENEKQGRTSGSTAWRLMRGELQQNLYVPHVWIIQPEYLINDIVKISYSTTRDKYRLVSSGRVIAEINKWSAGTMEIVNMFRKEEKDWKQVYLARQEGSTMGSISWKVDLTNCHRKLDVVVLNLQHTTFENGQVVFSIQSGETCAILPQKANMWVTKSFVGATTLILTATLTGGKGDVAWQHAQLFRQATDSEEFPFSISLVFK